MGVWYKSNPLPNLLITILSWILVEPLASWIELQISAIKGRSSTSLRLVPYTCKNLHKDSRQLINWYPMLRFLSCLFSYYLAFDFFFNGCDNCSNWIILMLFIELLICSHLNTNLWRHVWTFFCLTVCCCLKSSNCVVGGTRTLHSSRSSTDAADITLYYSCFWRPDLKRVSTLRLPYGQPFFICFLYLWIT